MIEALWGILGFGLGCVLTWALARSRRPAPPATPSATATVPEPAPPLAPKGLEVVAEPRPEAVETPPSESEAGEDLAPPHLLSLIGTALRGPLRRLRREGSAPADVLDELERIAWQTRMLVARPRPMKAQPTSLVSLLQSAAEEVPLLSEGKVGTSWSILNRQPAHVDPDRMQACFRELLTTGAEMAGERGRVGIKILQGSDAGFPVQIEIEIGRRGTEADALATLVSRHLVESQGGRLEIDGNVTRVLLRTAAPEPVASVA